MKKHFGHIQSQELKQVQRLILSPQMQQALHLLQLPVLELSNVITNELEQNPVLEYSDNDSGDPLELPYTDFADFRSNPKREEEDLRAFVENTLAYECSLFEFLMQQARDSFVEIQEVQLAELIIGSLDNKGFLTTTLEELATLHDCSLTQLSHLLSCVQNFDPPGIGARNLQECFLIQLRKLKQEESLCYLIIKEYYQDLLQNRIPLIAKKLKKTAQEIRQIVEAQIRRLNPHPASGFSLNHYKAIPQAIIPDIFIASRENEFSVEINEERIPNFRLNNHYLKLLEDPYLPVETRQYIHEKMTSGKWLLRNIHERNHTLYRIAKELLIFQRDFFTKANGALVPLTMKEISEKLELHESTIARAVANKYISSPRGILPFRAFFTHAITTDEGESISSSTVKQALIEMIEEENPQEPLSDEILSSKFKERGIPCARRTVAKYRGELGIGNTLQRKRHISH